MPPLRIPGSVRAHALKIAAVAILSLPAIMSFVGSGKADQENRSLARLPPLPHSAHAAARVPADLTAWANDHMGYREGLIKLNNRLHMALFHEFTSSQLLRGQHGRYFLAAHGANQPPFFGISQVCGNMGADAGQAPRNLNRLFAGFAAMGLHPRLLIVPSAPVIHSADLPAALAENCARSDTPVAAVLASPALAASARRQILFPLEQMRSIKDRAILYPKTWFHWTGDGLDEVARLSIAHFWGMAPPTAPPLKRRSIAAKSDVAHLSPGLGLDGEITLPDLAASGIDACAGPACMPEMGDAGRILDDITRFRNPAAPARRLVILSDSFGSKIAPWYARYYRDVWQISTSYLPRLRPDQLAQIRAALLEEPAGTDILLLYHDGTVVSRGGDLGLGRLHARGHP